MNLHERARAITAESLNGGGWQTPKPARHEPVAADNPVTGRRRLRELMQAAGEAPDETETEAS